MARNLPAGRTGCSYSTAPDDPAVDPCDEPASWHFINAEAFTLAACPAHFASAEKSGVDFHPFGEMCEWPGTLWVFSDGDVDGTCIWPPAEAVAASAQRELSLAGA